VLLAPNDQEAAEASISNVLYTGVVKSTEGIPLGNRAVEISVWPSETSLATLSEGAAVQKKLISTAQTRTDGSFTSTANISSGFPSSSGIYDVSIIAAGPGTSFSVAETSLAFDATSATFSAIPELSQTSELETQTTTIVFTKDDGGGGGTEPVDPTSNPQSSPMMTSAAGDQTADAGTAQISSSPDSTSAPFVEFSINTQYDPSAAQTDPDADANFPAQSCGTRLTKSYPGRLTYVGAIHASTNGHKTDFILTSGSDASLQTAVNTGRGFKAGSNISRNMSSSTNWSNRTTSGHKVLGTYYTLGKYRTVYCTSGYMYDTVKAKSHEGGAVVGTAATPSATYCRTYLKNTGISKTRTKAVTWSAGIKTSGIVGFDLNSSSGYSSSEKLDVQITASSRQICGTKGYPAESPSRLMVKP
jgi:hypothetical protein